jgi:hypothetical protein
MNMSNDKIAEQTIVISLAIDEIQEIARNMSVNHPEKSEEIKLLCTNIQEENKKLIAFIRD